VQYLASIPNPGAEGAPKFLHSADQVLIERWIKAEDRPGFSIYECPNPLKPGAPRHGKDSLLGIIEIFLDIDFRHIVETSEQADERLLRRLLLPPTLLVDSGHGRHPRYRLKELILCGDPAFERACTVQEKLIEYFAADPQVRPWSLLRRPGTTNSKHEPHVLCQVIQHGSPVDLTELEELCDLIEGAPLLTRKPSATNGHDRAAGEPWPSESKAPIDVEARLASMKFHGAGDSGVHVTQLQVTASLLRSGVPVDDVVAQVLGATRRVVADDLTWDWDEEKLTIERMCFHFVSKNPELAPLLPDKLFAAWNDRLAEGRTQLRIVYARHLKWHIRSQENKAESTGSANDYTATGSPPGAGAHAQKPRGWNYFDTTEITPQRWCVKKIIPETGVGVLAGMWGSYKTTTALELAVSIMTGQLFANQYRIKRQGAVLYFATEGAGTLQSRLTAVAKARGAPDKLPFAWRCDCPALTDRAAATILNRYVDEASAHFRQTYNLPVSFVGIDTYINAANLAAGDDNDAAVTQRAFSTLRAVANHSGAFVLVVDHYGKVAEAGTRGSSAKEGNADTVLATLAEREDTGTISRTRMAARKQRDGMSGFEVPFTPEVIELGLDEDGDPATAVILNWGKQQQAKPPGSRRKSRDADLLAKVLADVVAKHGFAFQPAPGAATVQACHAEDVQREFYSRRPTKGTETQQRQKRWSAYNRGLAILSERELVATAEINGSIILWRRS
jgi:AAA domain